MCTCLCIGGTPISTQPCQPSPAGLQPTSSSVYHPTTSTSSSFQSLPAAVPTQRQSRLSSVFNWNPTSLIGKKRKAVCARKSGLKKKIPTWSHMFVCLANINQDTLPTLQIAGLGEKKMSLNAYVDAQDIYHDLLFQFPKLSDSGGFELLRIPEGGGGEATGCNCCSRFGIHCVLSQSCGTPCQNIY